MTLFKNIALGRGDTGPRLQLRWEAYKVFNHTQYATIDTTARFNPAGQQINATGCVSEVLQKQIWVMMFQGNQPLPRRGEKGNIDDPKEE